MKRVLLLRQLSIKKKSHFVIQLQSYHNGRTDSLKDYTVSFLHKSNFQLLRSLLVFNVCKVPFIVINADSVLRKSYRFLGTACTNAILKASFFGHFCAGEDEDSIRPTIKNLELAGIGSILDYAAENDVTSSVNDTENSAETKDNLSRQDRKTVQCRIYDYKNEDLCDFHAEVFAKCIRSVKAVSPTGFAAIKCTALGNPELLKRVSNTLVEIKNLFMKLDLQDSGYVRREDFLKTFNTIVDGKSSLQYFDGLDGDKDGKIDYIEWTNGLDVLQLHNLTEYCTEKGPLFASVLNDEERILFAKMRQRLYDLAALAQSEGVRVMIDAEQTYFQPAIDNLTYSLCRQFNNTCQQQQQQQLPQSEGNEPIFRSQPVVFSTYQMYLKDSVRKLKVDIQRARKGDYIFAAKLVRGAYMDLERSLAAEGGKGDPIHESLQATHDAYNHAVRDILLQLAGGQRLEVMIATHNQQSVEDAMRTMEVSSCIHALCCHIMCMYVCNVYIYVSNVLANCSSFYCIISSSCGSSTYFSINAVACQISCRKYGKFGHQ